MISLKNYPDDFTKSRSKRLLKVKKKLKRVFIQNLEDKKWINLIHKELKLLGKIKGVTSSYSLFFGLWSYCLTFSVFKLYSKNVIFAPSIS